MEDNNQENNLYHDTTQEAVEKLKIAAAKVREEAYEDRIDVRDVVKDILFFFVAVAIGFGWMLLMQLIISFVSLGYIHMNIEKMIIVSFVCAFLVGIFNIYKMVVKYRKKS